MRLLVTGGCGFKGSNFTRFILQHYGPEMITNVDALVSGNLQNVDGVAEAYGERYEFLKADLADEQRMEAVFSTHQYYAVIHFAAEPMAHHDGTETPDDAAKTVNLLNRARHHGVRRFILVTTDAAPCEAAVAAGLDAWKKYGHEVVIVRGTNVYGPFQPFNRLIPRSVMGALTDRPIPVVGQGTDLRDWLHVDDFSSAIFAALFEGRPGETYEVRSGQELRTLDVVHFILDQLGKGRDLIELQPELAPTPPRSGGNGKIREELLWKPRHQFELGLKETIQWYVRNREWWKGQLGR